jgi:hypothetical protein
VTADARIAAIERATGRSWDTWLAFLTGIDAERLSHHEIATALVLDLDGKIDNPAWWGQSIAVAYEQSIGRRVPGQQPDGTFRTSVSRSTPLAMLPLIAAWTAFAASDPDVRAAITGEPRVSGTENRHSWRARGPDGITITVLSEPRPGGTASLIVQHGGSLTLEDNEAAKTAWTTIIGRFLASI